MSDWHVLTRHEKVLRATDAMRELVELKKTYPYREIYIPERDQHYPILGLIAWWSDVLEELDNEKSA